jgi:hypothetical protein
MTIQETGTDRARISDGRYLGNNGRYWLELRVDTAKSTVVSGDLQSTGPAGGRAVSASFRTRGDTSTIEWTAPDGTVAAGTLSVLDATTAASAGITVRLTVSEALGVLPAETALEVKVTRAGLALREVGLEIETEEGVDLRGGDGGDLTTRARECLEHHGFAVAPVGETTVIPANPGGWSESDILAELDRQLRRTSQAWLGDPAWDLHLLMLSATDRRNLLGVMFDGEGLPRQGAAVFVDTIRELLGDEPADTQIIQAIVHEIGHVLNLVHRFDRDVRRSRSTSFMNYPWRYGAGEYPGDSTAFWEKFRFTFDDDERDFLLHAPRSQVIPGGSPFGSARYWPEPGIAGNIASGRWNDLRLWLTPPRGGTTFVYGQPVYLEVSLLNTGCQRLRLPRHVLDLKAGQLELLVRRWEPDLGPVAARLAESKSFSPIMRRCFVVAAGSTVELGYGDSLHMNTSLVYGADGFTFKKEGAYEVVPVLTFPAAEDEGVDDLVVGEPLRIRVAPPSPVEEQDGETLVGRADVGAYLALGGSPALQDAGDALEDLRVRRDRRTPAGRTDPVVAALARCAGIYEGRNNNTRRAADLLAQATTPEGLSSFDPHTAEHTLRLATRYATAPAVTAASAVVVDLWTRPESGSRRGGRGAGFLIGTDPAAPGAGTPGGVTSNGRGWAVLTPASQLPAEVMTGDVGLEGTVSAPTSGGLTERVAVSRIDLVSAKGREANGPALALLQLAHSVPGPRVLADPADSGDGLVDGFLGRDGTATAVVASMREGALEPLAQAADDALPDPAFKPLAGTPATVFTYPGRTLDEVAIRWCTLFRSCDLVPPDDQDTPYDLGGDLVVHRRPAGPGPCSDAATDASTEQ